jgi:hypothetical protein
MSAEEDIRNDHIHDKVVHRPGEDFRPCRQVMLVRAIQRADNMESERMPAESPRDEKRAKQTQYTISNQEPYFAPRRGTIRCMCGCVRDRPPACQSVYDSHQASTSSIATIG